MKILATKIKNIMFCNSLQQLKFLLHAKQNLFFIFIQIFLTTLFLYSQHWKIFAKIQKISWNILCVIKFSNFTCFQLKTNTKETESTLKSAHHMLPPVDYLIIHRWIVEGGFLWFLLQSITISSKYTCWYICISWVSIHAFSVFTV